uniref:Uncharacterized protein n=1 Tax=Vitis vinifera TaxID=29760 RepID=A5BVB8_VITVI|nr:hypothetical protein VITISV_000501 [Vitis vinifera]
MAKKMEAHLHEEFKLWSFIVLCQIQSRMQGGKREKSNMKNSRGQQLLDTFRVLPGVYFMHTISLRSSGSQESNASNGARIGVETKKLWLFEDNCAKLSKMSCENFAGCFVAAKPPLGTRVPFHSSTPSFRSCEMDCEMAYENVSLLSHWLRNGLQAVNQVANHL